MSISCSKNNFPPQTQTTRLALACRVGGFAERPVASGRFFSVEALASVGVGVGVGFKLIESASSFQHQAHPPPHNHKYIHTYRGGVDDSSTLHYLLRRSFFGAILILCLFTDLQSGSSASKRRGRPPTGQDRPTQFPLIIVPFPFPFPFPKQNRNTASKQRDQRQQTAAHYIWSLKGKT
jgi:hypothetical protein